MCKDLRYFSRRQFLKGSMALSVAAGLGGEFLLPRKAAAAGFDSLSSSVLVHIALDGGPDMRYLFPPAWNATGGSYGRRYWEVRSRVHQAGGGASALESRWNNDFFHQQQGNTQFGILRKCGFLKQMWDGGQLALVNNVFGATTRDHQHATLVVEQGNSNASRVDIGSGWGGRLAAAAGGNVLALSRAARQFTFGPAPDAPRDLHRVSKENLVHVPDMREVSLYHPTPDVWQGPPQYVARSLKGYYATKGPSISKDSPYFPFIKHERELRAFGRAIDARLAGVAVPGALDSLAKTPGTNGYVGLQARNLYDALACHDLLNLRVASLEVPGWDTHDNERSEIENIAEHVFGERGIMAALQQNLPDNVWSKLVFVLGGEFGRQLVDNGSGTDHGVGTSMLVLGRRVRGGLYGDMYPEEELSRLDEPSPDIKGQTAIEQVFGAVCEGVAPGSRDAVFPQIGGTPLESGVPINGLIA